MKENEILKKLSEPLAIEDIDFRVQSINKGGFATILAYKNARVDMKRLDEVCGVYWQDKYELIDGQLFCSIGVKINNEWIWRQDVGTESMTEKTKGRASDAYKRSGFRWGIGRELYYYPLIQVKLNPDEFEIFNGKAKQTWNLKLKDWVWDVEFEDKKVVSLTAKDEKGVLRFNFPNKTKIQQPDLTKNTQSITTPQKTTTSQKPWLNITDQSKKFTKEWVNITKAINEKRISSVKDVRKYYAVSKNVETRINQLLNF